MLTAALRVFLPVGFYMTLTLPLERGRLQGQYSDVPYEVVVIGLLLVRGLFRWRGDARDRQEAKDLLFLGVYMLIVFGLGLWTIGIEPAMLPRAVGNAFFFAVCILMLAALGLDSEARFRKSIGSVYFVVAMSSVAIVHLYGQSWGLGNIFVALCALGIAAILWKSRGQTT